MTVRRRPAKPKPGHPANATNARVRGLLHELQVHSEELTVQNDQLLRAQSDLEDARDRYANLYDFASVAMMTLDHRGVILDVNIAAGSLLQQSRAFIVGVPLMNLVDAQSRDAIRRFLAMMKDESPGGRVEVTLAKQPRIVQIIGRHMQVQSPSDPRIFASLIDVTVERQLEKDREEAYQREQQRAAELSREVEVRAAAEERVKGLLDRLVTIQEQERRRLALNLHDHLGQQLTALRLAIAGLRDAKGQADASKRMERVEQLVSQLDRDVDFLAWELRPAALDDVGLEAALAEFLRQWSWANGAAADFHHTSQDTSRLPAEIESHLYRICQEALNNVSKHADASNVSVLLERRADEMTLIVEDDGRGFDLEREGVHRVGMGLTGMQERAALIGGHVQLESAPGKGTTVFVRVPVRTPASAVPPPNAEESNR